MTLNKQQIKDISEYLIHHQIIKPEQIFESYLIEIQQPNNNITKLPIFKKYTFETFIEDLEKFDLTNSLIKIKLLDKTLNTKIRDFNKIIKSYYSQAIDIIFIFYFDSSGGITFSDTKQINKYYKHHYIIHCQNIRNVLELINNNNNEFENEELNNQIEKLKLKNMMLCQELDSIKLSNQENLKQNNIDYINLQLDYEQLQLTNHSLKSKNHNLKSKLKDYSDNNQQLNEQLIKLQKENTRLKNDNDEFYISIINGY